MSLETVTAILAIIVLTETVLVLLFILPQAKGKHVSKRQLLEFIRQYPDMFDQDILDEIFRVVQKRMSERDVQ